MTQAGVQLTWPILSRAGAGPIRSEASRQADDRLAGLGDQVDQRQRTLGILAADYADRAAQWTLRSSTRRVADQYTESLKTELAAGTSTLDTVLQGMQLAYKAREDEWTARWDTLAALVTGLKAAGRLVSPRGAP